MKDKSLNVDIKRTGPLSWEIIFCFVTSEASLDGNLEVNVAQGELTQEAAEAFVWRNRRALFQKALQAASVLN